MALNPGIPGANLTVEVALSLGQVTPMRQLLFPSKVFTLTVQDYLQDKHPNQLRTNKEA